MKLPERYFPILILFVCGLIFLPHLGILPVNIMEARNFTTAREMLQDQNWILTTLNGEPRYEKPPLPTWMTAISGAIFGIQNVAALRLPAVLMAFLLAGTTWLFAKKITGNAVYALISVLVMVTSFYILWSGRNGQWDIFTHAFMMLGIYHFYQFFTDYNNLYRSAVLAGLFLGLSFMSKGPVSLYALFLPFLIAFGTILGFGSNRRIKRLNRTFPLILMILITLVLSGWWHLYIYLADSRAAEEITAKEINAWNNRHVRPFYYYWNFFIQSGTWTILGAVSLLYPFLKDRVVDRKGYAFTLVWTLASVILLSFIPEKKPRYLLPVLIPLSLNIGFYLEYLFRAFRSGNTRIFDRIVSWFQFGLIGTVGILIPVGGYWFLGDHLEGNWVWFILLSLALFTLGWSIWRALIQKRIDRAFFLTIAFMCAITTFGLPLSRSVTVNPEYRNLSTLRVWQDSSGLPVYEFAEFSPELIWDFGRSTPVLYDGHEYRFPKESRFGLLAADKLEANVRSHFQDYQIEQIGYFDLNNRSKSQGGHNGRLYRDFYLITKP